MSYWIRKLKSATVSQATTVYRNGGMRRLDAGIALAIAIGILILYARTMPPSLLDGDSGRWQYVCHVLGISYPTGYPGLTVVGKLWELLVPVGSVAYRISLMSVTFGALSAALSYLFLRKAAGNRLAAALGALLFATLPSTWWWSISIKSYALNLVFVSACFLLLFSWARTHKESTLRWFAFAYGLSLTNHSTMVLFVPAFAAFILLTDARILRSPRRIGMLVLCALLPMLLYLYIPLRGNALWMSQGSEPGLPWPVAVSRGLISSEYEPSLTGFANLILAPHETRSLVSSWDQVPQQLLTVYGGLLNREFLWFYIALGLAGLIRLATRHPRYGIPIVLGFLAFPPFVVQYGHGMQSAFLLPSNLMFTAGIVSAIAGILGGIESFTRRDGRVLKAALQVTIVAALAIAIVGGAATRYTRMDRSNDHAICDYWSRILTHPLEEKAGILGHSGILTSLWYLQNVEGLRRDLFGIFPPSEEIVDKWLGTGHTLYLAGPLEGWLPKAWERYRLTPWGVLVKIALHSAPDEQGEIAPQHTSDGVMGGKLALLGYDFAETIPAGTVVPVRLYWQTRDYLPSDYLVSLRLIAPGGQWASIVEDRLVSAWYPEPAVPADRFMLGMYDLPVPVGTPPGRYAVQMVVHHPDTGEALWLSGASEVFQLGHVEVTRPQQVTPDTAGLERTSTAVFGGQVEMLGYTVRPVEVQTGQQLTLEVLWEVTQSPGEDNSLLVQWVDESGHPQRETRLQPTVPTSTWRTGDLVRDWLTFSAPPGLRDGRYALRLAWVTPGGEPLGVRKGWLPAGDSLELATVQVTDRPHRFDLPVAMSAKDINFSDRVRLLGYDTTSENLQPGDHLPLTLYWQSLAVTDISYKVFVHLVDSRGQIRAQQDSIPGQGTLPTTGWVEDEVVEDPHELALSPDLPTGEYKLIIGLYDAISGARLPIAHGGEDHAHLTTVGVRQGTIQ